MRSNQRDILEQRLKFIAKRTDTLVTELEELDVEAQELVIALRVLDRYAIRLGGMSTRGKTNKEPEPDEEEDEEEVTQPTVIVEHGADLKADDTVKIVVEGEAKPLTILGHELTAEQLGDLAKGNVVYIPGPAAEPVQPETPAPAPETPAEPETPPSEAGPAEKSIYDDNGIYKPLADGLGQLLTEPEREQMAEDVRVEEAPGSGPEWNHTPPLAQPEPFNIRKKVEPLKDGDESHYRKTGQLPKPETKAPEPATIEPESATLPTDKRTTAYKQAKADRETAKSRRAGTANIDHSAKEPAPAWRGKPAEPSNIYSVTLGEETLSLAGTWLMQGSKMVKKLDKWEQAVIITLMKDFPGATSRTAIKNMVKDIDRVIGDLRAIMALTPAKIETTHGGWKLCPRNG